MLAKTDSVILKSVPYKESSSIVSAYTEEFGLKSFIVKAGRKKNAPVRSSFFQPLQLMHLVIYDNAKRSLNQIKECSIYNHLTSLRTDIIKSAVVFFITEILQLSLKEKNPDAELFAFIKQSVLYLNDNDDKHIKDFHIYFLIKLSSYLGFEPMDNYSDETCFFDLSEGKFKPQTDVCTADKDNSLLWHNCLQSCLMNYSPFVDQALQRRELLGMAVQFYQYHITNSRPVKSLAVLHSLM
ncbi:MAG: DNA repair protein RecO [Bacteroidales bacterium]|nr:DNA repair protein RecO [Bacteroidales bacterium]